MLHSDKGQRHFITQTEIYLHISCLEITRMSISHVVAELVINQG